MQARTARQAEKAAGQLLKLGGAHGFGADVLFMPAIEQPVDVQLEVTLTAAHGLGITEQEQNTGAGFDLPAGNAMQQAVEQFDRRGFVAMDAGRQQQVAAVVQSFRRAHFKRAFAEPAHLHAVDSQLNFLRRFTTGEGQFKQFAEGEHRASFISGCSLGRERDRLRRRPGQPVPFPVAGLQG